MRSVRAYNPWPTAFSYIEGQPLRMLECAPLLVLADRPPGTIFSLEADDSPPRAGFAIAAVDGAVTAITVQGPGGKPMPASAYLRGHTDIIGKRLRRAAS